MKKFSSVFLLLAFAFFCVTPVFAVDTLEVFVLRVQFAEEKTDNSLTTGKGTFGSIPDKSYSLDPVKQAGKVPYWEKHLQFADAYYRAASGGKLVVKSRVFPVYTLKKQIIDYNRTSKMDGEKTAEFDEARSRDYLTFVYDAVAAAAAADTSKASPFRIPLSDTTKVKRSYMIVHAGASRLVDGGSMGTDGADTPGDFMDIYVSRDAWEYLMPDSAQSAAALPTFGVNEMGDTVVNGLVIPNSSIDTLRTVMVVSETASQDGLNWGVNGIVVNQIGRELGLPNTYDVMKGISRLGYFDAMDFAGYNAGNGFMPALPAAWERAYMGWSKIKEVRPTAGHPVTVDIAAAGSGLGTEIVKVPLNGSEYLLIENRQRSWDKKGKVSVVLGSADEDSDTTMRTVSVDSLTKVFEDSTCTAEGKCKVNKNKAKGLVVGMTSFDAGLPASGVAVWKVNDWYLRETLDYGIANYWGGDTLRDHQFGIALVEADGILSIGKTFKNALGQDTYDYGSGTDLLPHKRIPTSSNSTKFEKVTTINPTGYANTKTTQGGYTGIKITVNVPKDAREEKTSNAFMGDSVVNYAAPVISVTISIDDGSIEGSKFPREIGLATAVRGAVFVDDPDNSENKILVVGSDDGNLQAFNALGDTLFVSDTSVFKKNVSKSDAESRIPLYRVGPNYGPLVGLAGDGKCAYSLHSKALVKTCFETGAFPVQKVVSLKGTATAGPLLYDDRVRFAEGARLTELGNDLTHYLHSDKAMPADFNILDMAFCGMQNGDHNNQNHVYTNDAGEVYFYYGANAVGDELRNGARLKVGGDKETMRVACTDLDRDSVYDAIVVGSRGTVAAIARHNTEKPRTIWKKEYKRGAAGVGGLKNETSGIAIGDVNGDNYPEVVFLGNNLVYALDRFGLPLPGFPVTISRGTPVVGFFSDPLLVDVSGDNIPEILVPSSDGLVYAYTSKGKPVTDGFPLAAGSFKADSVYAPMSIFVADAVPGKKSAGPEIYAFHRTFMNAFRLRRAADGAAKSFAAWALPAAGNERTGFFDASALDEIKKATSKDEITEFFVYPNPVRGGQAKARFEIGAAAKSVTFEMYDITGLCVFKEKMSDAVQGRNEFSHLDLKKLGSDVYTARLKVEFADGKTKQKLYRVGVVK